MKKTNIVSMVALATAMGLASPAWAQTADVIQYWTAASESAAMNVIADGFKAEGGTWIDSPAAGFDAAVASAMSRIAGGQPPTAVLMTPRGAMRDLAEAGALRDISDLSTAGGWEAAVSPLVYSRLVVDDKVVAVPLGVHAENWIWYSKPLFDELGIAEPTNLDEMFAAADKIKEAGHTAFAVGGEPWQEIYILTGIIQALGGPDYWNQLIVERDPAALENPILAEAFELFRKVSTYTDESSPGRSWSDTTNMIIRNEAGMQFMGDWARGEFVAAGKEAGKDFGCMLVPTSTPTYAVVLDVFAFPVNSDEDRVAGQSLLANTVMDPVVQAKVAGLKGSVPARTDVDTSLLDECAAKGVAALATEGVPVPTTSDSLPGDGHGQLVDLATQFWTDPNFTTEAAVQEFGQIVQSL